MPDSTKIFSYFDEFHSQFKGDVKTLDCGKICTDCPDNCEACMEGDVIDFKYVLAFLPYEAEYVAGKMNIPYREFKDKYLYGIRTGEMIINVLKFNGQCPFLNSDFSCAMGESKIISCKIFPLIHYPLVGFAFSGHCDLTKYPEIKSAFTKGIPHYEALLRKLRPGKDYLYLRECFDILQLSAEKIAPIYESKKYDLIDLEEFKKCLVADPRCI